MPKIFNVKARKVVAGLALLVLFVLRPPSTTGQQQAAFGQFTITNGHTVATNFAATNIKALRVTMIGLKANGVSNAAAVYVGPTTNAQYYIIYPGERHIIETQPGTIISLNTWWLRTPSANDGIHVIYE